MLPPDTINPGTDPLIDHGGLYAPKDKPDATLAFRTRSGCFLMVFVSLLLLVVGACALLTWGAWLLVARAASALGPLSQIDGKVLSVALFCILLLALAFVAGFILPPWRNKLK